MAQPSQQTLRWYKLTQLFRAIMRNRAATRKAILESVLSFDFVLFSIAVVTTFCLFAYLVPSIHFGLVSRSPYAPL